MKKRYYITAFIFGILGIIYGTFCNYFIRNEKILFLSIISGIFVGLLYFAMYYVLTFFLGNQYDEDDKALAKYMKMLIRIQNLIVFNALIFGSSLLIATGGLISLPFFWIHISNIVLSIIIITVANIDGKRIRKARTREKKKANIQPSPMVEILTNEQVKHLICTAPNMDIADKIIESLTGFTEPRDKYLLIKKMFEDSLINISLNTDEEVYIDILKQVMEKNKIKENTP